MKRRLKWAKVDYLSLCPRGVNRMRVVYKSDDAGTFALETLTKESAAFDDKGELLAVAYPAEHRDSQGDISSQDVCKEMAYSFMRSGAKLDLRHDNAPLGPERAYVAENFLIQKSDTRFHGWKDNQGATADLTGSWAVVLKVDDPELRKLYRDGKWQGVSFEGHCGFVIEKEATDEGEPTMDFEKLLKAIAEGNEKLVKSIVDQLKPAAPPAPPVKKEDEEPKFSGPLTVENLRKHREAVMRHKLVKSVDMNDTDALAAVIEQLEKDRAAQLATETVEQKAERLSKENLDLLARVKKAERASNQPVQDTTAAPGAFTTANGTEIKKSEVDLGTEIAAMANARNGFGKK